MDNEKWLHINGYEELYEISNMGRVRSIFYFKKGRVMKPSLQMVENYKRYRVNLVKGGKAKCFKVHRLVAQAFIPNPENKLQVNHIDNNPLNNIVTNLEWVTNLENSHHSMNQGRLNRGSKNGMAKLNEEEVIKIRTSNLSVLDLSNKYKISKSAIKNILNNKRWKHVLN